jgi:hypothetical protein
MSLLFALASILIVYPILFVLPVGLKAKQKFLLLIISLVISLVGILSKEVFSSWQTILIMLALAGLSTILVSKRMTEHSDMASYYPRVKHSIHDLDDEEFVSNMGISIQDKIEDNEEISGHSLIDNTEKIEREGVFEQEILPFLSDRLINQIETNDIQSEEEIETFLEEIHTERLVAAAVEEDKDELKMDEIENIEDFLLEELTEISLPEEVVKVDSSNSSNHYLSEIEKLLEAEEAEDFRVTEESKTNPPLLKEIKLEELY